NVESLNHMRIRLLTFDLRLLNRHRRLLDDSPDDGLGCFALAAAEEAFEDHAVRQDQWRQPLDVVGYHEGASFDQGQCLCGPIQAQGPAGADADAEVLAVASALD